MSLITKLQDFFGVSKSELTISSIILLGLIVGLILQWFNNDEEQNNNNVMAIYQALDSLAEVQKTTYVGTDINNNPYPELEKGDTIIKKIGFQKKTKISSGKINLNKASKLELMKLPGVGESTALKIIDYRSRQFFNSPEDIMNIKGIGQKKYEKMKPFIEVK